MKGTLSKQKKTWLISYTYSDQTMHGDLSTDEYPLIRQQQVDSICNPFRGKDVEFEFIKDKNGKKQEVVKIIDNKIMTWDNIEYEAFEFVDGCDCNEGVMVFNWLKRHYEVPVKKINKK
jgi:hypothetical protein